jgi:hypothetical protein
MSFYLVSVSSTFNLINYLLKNHFNVNLTSSFWPILSEHFLTYMSCHIFVCIPCGQKPSCIRSSLYPPRLYYHTITILCHVYKQCSSHYAVSYNTNFIVLRSTYWINTTRVQNFPKILAQPQHFRYQKGDWKRVPNSRPTNIRHHYTKFSHAGNFTPRIQ